MHRNQSTTISLMNIRRNKSLSLIFLPILLLVSCEKIELNEDVTRLIYSPTLENAKETVKTVSSTNINTIYDVNNEEIGKETYSLSIDRSAFQKDYSYLRIDTYSGLSVSLDGTYNTGLYVSEKKTTVSYNESESLYEVTVQLKGYKNKDDVSALESKTAGIFKYTQSKFDEEIDNKIFYSQNVSSRYTGGYYMADFFKTILSEYKSFSVKDNTLVYEIKDKTYKLNKEEALVNETLVMNDFGMLVSMDQSAYNTTTLQKSISSTKVVYNS